jgi:integrase
VEWGDEKIPIDKLSKNKLVTLISKCSELRKTKYERRKETRYGNLNRGFTESELKLFLQSCKNKKAKLAFFLMSQLGLRVGEVVKLQLEDIDFHKNKIRVFTEKAHTTDFLFLHVEVRKVLYDWVRLYLDKIQMKGNYILFSDNLHSGREYVSPDWLRKYFRERCHLCGLNTDYGTSKESVDGKRARKLYRLTTHSLRHYFVTRVYRKTKNPLHTQRLARHLDFKATQIYIRTDPEELDQTLADVFEEDDVKESDIKEFVKAYAAWKKH